ncbi:peroxidase 46 [Sesamum indicum]|uniref:Peroxidase n=1 Tax=Sesamum indicum TaxID=4182 RepID=A0A6I9TBB9_SESIN|nr:peroxidase 46 [Sesamum indicum]
MGKTEFCAYKASSHHKVLMLLFFVILCLSFFPPLSSSSSLSFDFYTGTCPAAEMMVKDTVRSASDLDPTIPGKLLRLLFHDCFVEGCDASVLLQGNGTELSDPANKSLGGFSVIDAAKRVLEIFCPETVSCADILALAARDAVEFAGGPNIQIPTGRRDGRISLAANVRPNIIDTSFTLDEMAKVFTAKGLSMDDIVTLSGAHTIGTAHCSSFNDRFKLDSNGNLTLIDSSLDRQYAAHLTKMCPSGAIDDSVTVSNDPSTPLLFDNQYYRILLEHKGLFQSDSALLNDERTRNRVLEFANNQDSFYERWAVSFSKLTGIGVKTDDEGEIRQSCSLSNNR